MLLDCSVGTAYSMSVTVVVAVGDYTDCANSGAEGFVTQFAVCFECMGYFVDFYCCASLLLHFLYFLKLGQLSPCPHLSTFGVMVAWGVAASWDCGSIFIGWFEVDVGGIGQSCLNSNRFPDIDPAPDHGVPAWGGIFSSGGGCCLMSFLGKDFLFLSSLQ